MPAHPWSRPGPLSRAHSGPLSQAIGLGRLLTPQDYLCDQGCAKIGPDRGTNTCSPEPARRAAKSALRTFPTSWPLIISPRWRQCQPIADTGLEDTAVLTSWLHSFIRIGSSITLGSISISSEVSVGHGSPALPQSTWDQFPASSQLSK